jgi:hypothetical protein
MRPERSARNSADSITSCLCICFIDHPPCPLRRHCRWPVRGVDVMVAMRLTVNRAQAFEQRVALVADQRKAVVVVEVIVFFDLARPLTFQCGRPLPGSCAKMQGKLKRFQLPGVRPMKGQPHVLSGEPRVVFPPHLRPGARLRYPASHEGACVKLLHFDETPISAHRRD